MQPTFGQVIQLARLYVGDERGSVFKDAYLLQWSRRMFDQLATVLRGNQLPEAKVVTAPIAVVAGTALVDPATSGIANFGEPELLEERLNGSGDRYTPVTLVQTLPQVDPSDKLRFYTLDGGELNFIAATSDIQIRMHYFASGNGEAMAQDATIAIDDSLNFLGAATAAAAGPGKGYTVEAKEARDAAYGADNRDPFDNLGGFLGSLIDPLVRVEQQKPCVPAMYRAGAWRR